jgi:N-acetylmuramoyl-L-alanine amidase
MEVTYKGSRVNFAYCKPQHLDLAVGGQWHRLDRLLRDYPYPWARASNANYFGKTMQGEAKDSGGAIYDTQIINGRPAVYVRGGRAWYSYDHLSVHEADVAVGAGPMLVVDGVIGDLEQRIAYGNFSGLRQTNKCERCALGYTSDGLLLHAVADALTLYELAQFFVERGCEWAMNLDGGGSVGLLEDGSLAMGAQTRMLPSALVIRETVTKEVPQVASPLFLQDFIPKGRDNRPGRAMMPQYLTVHDTGNPNKGADAVAHAKYLKGSAAEMSPVSWHYTVDDKCIVQHLPWNETAYHAGDGGYGKGNSTSVGIEICENPDGNRAKAEDNAIALIVDLLKEIGLSPDKVVPHKYWTGKQCPRVILGRKDGWFEFMAKIRGKYVG